VAGRRAVRSPQSAVRSPQSAVRNPRTDTDETFVP